MQSNAKIQHLNIQSTKDLNIYQVTLIWLWMTNIHSFPREIKSLDTSGNFPHTEKTSERCCTPPPPPSWSEGNKTRRATGCTKNKVDSRWEWFGISTTSRGSEIWEIRWTSSPFPHRPSPAPASHRHLVPRWCISANLRSLVLPLSFLPASSLVFPSPVPLLISSHPVFLEEYLLASLPHPPPSNPRSSRILGMARRSGGDTEEQSIPGPVGRPYRRDLIGPIRYSVATVYTYVYAPVCFVPVSEFWHPVSH